MANPQEKLADALASLKQLQDDGWIAIHSNDIPRRQREILLRNGFLRMVMKGWYVPCRPDDREGDTTTWFSSFWDFCAQYCHDRFGDQWCLSPEQSISIHVGNRTVPKQLIVRSGKGGNKPIELLHGTSIFDFRGSIPSASAIEQRDGLNLYKLTHALCESSAIFYQRNAHDARAALASIHGAGELLPVLLAEGRSTIAGRLCGAFRNIGRADVADEIRSAMKGAGYEITEVDPFDTLSEFTVSSKSQSPHAARLSTIWDSFRDPIIKCFPHADKRKVNVDKYLAHIEDNYIDDAYHSLSIEGYQVSPELIERVKSGRWNPGKNKQDLQQQNALAARGYYQAFKLVRKSIKRVLDGQDAAKIARKEHNDWYRELFAPLIKTGALNAGHLAGYRSGRVFIKESRHVPVAADMVADSMDAFFDLLERESSPAVRIVAGHFFFVFIHPYFDGNGRVARFLMNLMMAESGYKWTIVPVERRNEYMKCLETASVKQDIAPFAKFIAGIVEEIQKVE